MKFKAFNPFIKQLRTDKGFRVEFDVSADQYDQIKDLIHWQDQVLDVEVLQEPIIETNTHYLDDYVND